MVLLIQIHGALRLSAETDSTLQTGDTWFYIPSNTIRSLSELRKMHETSIGRNTNAIIDFSPAPDGTISVDQKLDAFLLRDYIRKCYNTESNASTVVSTDSPISSHYISLNIPKNSKAIDIVLREDQTNGQAVRSYVVTGIFSDGKAIVLSSGQSNGNRKIDIMAKPVSDCRK